MGSEAGGGGVGARHRRRQSLATLGKRIDECIHRRAGAYAEDHAFMHIVERGECRLLLLFLGIEGHAEVLRLKGFHTFRGSQKRRSPLARAWSSSGSVSAEKNFRAHRDQGPTSS